MSSAGDDTDVMFEIGVMEKPDTNRAITELAKQVLSSQEAMRQGIERVGITAKAASAALTPLMADIKSFRAESFAMLRDVQNQSAGIARPSRQPINRVVVSEASSQQRASDPADLPIESVMLDLRDGLQRVNKSIVDSVQKNVASLSPLSDNVKKFRDETVQMLEAVSREFDRISGRAAKAGGGQGPVTPNVPSQSPREFPSPTPSGSKPGKNPLADIPTNIEGVIKKLGEGLDEQADAILKSFESKVRELPNSVIDVNARIKSEYDKRVADQAKAFEEMSQQLDEAVDKQYESQEKMNAAVVKGAKAVVGAARGFAELGLVSEESSEQLLKGLVAIQGAVDILDGAADLVEAFSMGWHGVRQNVKAAADVQKAQQAIAAASLPQLRAYQASLIAEARLANAATIANERLSKSRGVSIPGVGGVASKAAVGAATQAAGTAATSTVARTATGAVGGAAGGLLGGAGASTIAGVGVGLLGTIAAAGAALAGATLGLVALKEAALGQASAQGSLSNKIVEYESSIIAGGLRMTGLFERFDSPSVKFLQNIGSLGDSLVSAVPGLERFKDQLNFSGGLLGDLAGLAASTAAVERAQKSLAKNIIINDANRAKQRAEIQSNNKLASNEASFEVEARSLTLKASSELARKIAELEKDQAGVVDAQSIIAKQLEQRPTQDGRADFDKLAEKLVALAGIATSAKTSEVDAAIKNESLSQSAQRDILKNALKQSETSIDENKQAIESRGKIRQSIEKEIDLIRQKRDIEVAGQQRVGELLKSQLDLKRQQLQASEDGEKSAALNFARLSGEDKFAALRALEAARTKGAEKLTDEQKDLLRNVGTRESIDFAERGDLAEAKKFGFGDQNFARDFKKEQEQLASEAKKLEAQVTSTYDVRVQLEADTQGLVADLVAKTKQLLSDNNSIVRQEIATQMQATKLEMNNKTADDLRKLKK